MNVGLLKNIINQATTHTESFLDSFKKQQGKAKIALASLLASGALLGGIKNCDKESEEKKIEKTEISYQQNSYRD